MIPLRLLNWLVTSFTILMLPYLISGVEVESLGAALAAAAILALMNIFVKPLLILVTLPLSLVTLGAFVFVINGLLFYWMDSLVTGIHIASFSSALFASLTVTLVSWFFGRFGNPERKRTSFTFRSWSPRRPMRDVTESFNQSLPSDRSL